MNKAWSDQSITVNSSASPGAAAFVDKLQSFNSVSHFVFFKLSKTSRLRRIGRTRIAIRKGRSEEAGKPCVKLR